MIDLIRIEDSGVWALPSGYSWDNVVTVYLDGKEIFEDVDFMKVHDGDIDVFRTQKTSTVSALMKK